MTPGVDFFRVDRSQPTRRILVTAAIMVALGATTIGAHLMHRLSFALGHLISLAGGMTMIAGLVLGFGSMAMILLENVYLRINDDGLLVHDNGKDVTIAWDDLDEVRVDEGGSIALARKDAGGEVRFFAGRGAPNVKKRIEDARRRAAHGLFVTS